MCLELLLNKSQKMVIEENSMHTDEHHKIHMVTQPDCKLDNHLQKISQVLSLHL